MPDPKMEVWYGDGFQDSMVGAGGTIEQSDTDEAANVAADADVL
jgi:hypothetical protein